MSYELDQNLGYFRTQDIALAVYLKTKGIKLVKITPSGPYRSEFTFQPVSQDLLTTWLTTEASAPLRLTINEYRHLLRTCRQSSAGVGDG